jgi:hypothetical protein
MSDGDRRNIFGDGGWEMLAEIVINNRSTLLRQYRREGPLGGIGAISLVLRPEEYVFDVSEDIDYYSPVFRADFGRAAVTSGKWRSFGSRREGYAES